MKPHLEPVEPVRPAAPWQGGKRALAGLIARRISEVDHQVYAEPFVGMGGVFLRRTHRPGCEIINDLNADVVTLFRVLQRHYAAFMDHLKYQVTSRREFERLSRTDPSTLTDLERAARFLYLQKTAYGGKVTGQNFGMSLDRARFDYSSIGPVLEAIYERMAGVTIESMDWRALIQRYDSAATLFYLDPPYWGCEDDYGTGLFGQDDFSEMAATLAAIEGKCILSINDVPEIRELFAAFRLEPVHLKYRIGSGDSKSREVDELLIYNFEPPELPLFG